MEATVERTGGCTCGAVRFAVRGRPLRAGLCHCLDCRKTSGSTFSFFAVYSRNAFSHTGELTTFQGRSFCLVCGCRIVNLRDDEAEIMVGSLDEGPTDLAPEYELWVPRREGWLHALPWANQFDTDRTNVGSNWRQSVAVGG